MEMDAISEEEENEVVSIDVPFIVKESGDRTKQDTETRLKETSRALLYLLVAFGIVILVFVSGLLLGYLIVWKDKSTHIPSQKQAICSNPPVLLISLDGFRSEYLERGLTPNIITLANEGVRAEFMKPSYPSLTFPNHFTLVTGLYPEEHGIVDNIFYDRELKEVFSLSFPTALDPKWWLGEPIWVTAHNAILKTAVYFWPGSEVPINGILPDIYFKYNKSVPYKDRIDTVLSWFDLPDRNRPQFMASYFEEPDSSGHEGGPESDLVDQALRRVDGVIKDYVDGLKERGVYDCVNVVIVSDHGMAKVEESMTMTLVPNLLPEEYFNQVEFFSYGIFCNLYVKNASDTVLIQEIYDEINQNLEASKAPADVYLRDEAPPEYNIGKTNKQRYGDIFIIAQPGAYVKTRSDLPSHISIGKHGYNNSEPQMTTIFIGHGPSFKSGSVIEPFQNIELYNLLCDLLDIRPAANNGTIDSLHDAISVNTSSTA